MIGWEQALPLTDWLGLDLLVSDWLQVGPAAHWLAESRPCLWAMLEMRCGRNSTCSGVWMLKARCALIRRTVWQMLETRRPAAGTDRYPAHKKYLWAEEVSLMSHLKGQSTKKEEMLSSFSNPCVVSSLYDFLCPWNMKADILLKAAGNWIVQFPFDFHCLFSPYNRIR